MGSPYLSRNESIILSTNNVIINTVPAEAILTNERLIIIDARHMEIKPQDIPFHVIETVTIGENSDLDPMISLSLVKEPGVTQTLGIVFPQAPTVRRVAERDEWAIRLKELSIVSLREGSRSALELLPPWVPGPLPAADGTAAPSAPGAIEESKFRNPPLVPRKPREQPASGNRTAIAAAAVVVIVIALAAGAYYAAPSLFGKSQVQPTTVPATTIVTLPTTVPATAPATYVTAGTTAPVTAAPTTSPELTVPKTGVYVLVKYNGSFNGTIGAPGRFRTIADTGDHIYQLSMKNEIVTATVQKLDNAGGKLTVEIYSDGKLVSSGSVTAPSGVADISVDLKSA